MQDIRGRRALVKRGVTAWSFESGSPARRRCTGAAGRGGCPSGARALREAGVESVAVCFLFSYLNPEHERRAAEIVPRGAARRVRDRERRHLPPVSRVRALHDRLYERLRGGTGRYLARLERALEDDGVSGGLHVMMSNGGVASAEAAAEKPVTLLLSGPAAGVLGVSGRAALAGRSRLITFDMGGTSADIGIVTEGGVAEASARDTEVAGYPLLVPMIDVQTIGAGGGSIAYVDDGGAFRVGPRSAGAVPGPACYGLGGDEPTITDANVVLGRIDPGLLSRRRPGARPRACGRRRRRSRVPARARPARGGRRHRDNREREHGPSDPRANGSEGP